MAKQTKNFKAEREHYYALMARLEQDKQQLQEQSHNDTQVLEARSQQIGCLLQDKGIIREMVREIADYIIMKFHECEDMTRSTFFAAVMTFVHQIMDDLYHLQGDLARRPVVRPTDVLRAPGVDLEHLCIPNFSFRVCILVSFQSLF